MAPAAARSSRRVISSTRPGTSGRPSGSYEGSAGSDDWPEAAHVPDHRDRADAVVVALEAPGGDRRVVDGAVEREVQLHVPLRAGRRGRPSRRSGGPGRARRTRGWRARSSGPGGVSDLGPSAQNSAITRPKSPSSTTSGGIRLAGGRVHRVAGAVVGAERCCRRARRARCRSSCPSRGSSRLLRRMHLDGLVLEGLVASPGRPSRGGGPGSIGVPVPVSPRQRERRRRAPSAGRPPAGRRWSPGSRSARSCARSAAAASGSGPSSWSPSPPRPGAG